MKNKNQPSEQFLYPLENRRYRGKSDTTNIHIHDYSLSCVGRSIFNILWPGHNHTFHAQNCKSIIKIPPLLYYQNVENKKLKLIIKRLK